MATPLRSSKLLDNDTNNVQNIIKISYIYYFEIKVLTFQILNLYIIVYNMHTYLMCYKFKK